MPLGAIQAKADDQVAGLDWSVRLAAVLRIGGGENRARQQPSTTPYLRADGLSDVKAEHNQWVNQKSAFGQVADRPACCAIPAINVVAATELAQGYDSISPHRGQGVASSVSPPSDKPATDRRFPGPAVCLP